MRPDDLGRVFAFLAEHKLASTHPAERARRPGEREVADLLATDPSALADLDEFLAPQGLGIHGFEQAALGLAPRGRIFVLARSSRGEASARIDDSWVWESLVDNRRREPVSHTVIWAAQMWAVMNWFFYTREHRAIEAVSGARDTRIDPPEFSEELRRHVECLRAKGPPRDERARQVHDVLTVESEAAIETRAQRFLVTMEKADMIEPVPGATGRDGQPALIYRQSLNAAVEMMLNLRAQAVGLLPPDEPGEGVLPLLGIEDE
ncbi:MAG: hypothetical protein K2Q10_11170 [Rhodospirillales bacterium]|nr:hypothetical protein [Rhodospirillales bacterium]